MEITIKITPEEIAALVLVIQERRGMDAGKVLELMSQSTEQLKQSLEAL